VANTIHVFLAKGILDEGAQWIGNRISPGTQIRLGFSKSNGLWVSPDCALEKMWVFNT